ncbi:MAG: hypothetical protein ACP5NZ_00020 [Nanobdellota archaeon]
MDERYKKLRIPVKNLEEVNAYLTSPSNTLVKGLLEIVDKYGGVREINRKAEEARKLENLLGRLEEQKSPYLKDIYWLRDKVNNKRFISMDNYKDKLLGKDISSVKFNEDFAVTLEVSALQYFPWLISESKRAIEKQELMPGRFIRVRNMKESEGDDGDLLAIGSAMQILGASYVETLDTKGTDGSNIHLNGPETITGYFGGVGQPNNHALKWADEFLYYNTNYGVKQVLNINPGTVLLGYMMNKLGIDNEFKISVFMGNDNPYSVLWTLMTAKLFSDENGKTPLVGFNLSNSVDNNTIELCSEVRKNLDLEDYVRFEHHIFEAYKSIVKQPYDKTEELTELAKGVKNISAKHEGGNVNVEQNREHPSDILDYFMPKEKILEQEGLMEKLEMNYLDKHEALNNTARALIKNGIPVIAAKNLHY